jgi:hypothetical protein
MNDSDYIVVFNILDSGYRQWWWPDGGLFLALLVFLIILVFWIIEAQKRGEKIAFFKVSFVAIALVGTSIALPLGFIGTFSDYQKCSHSLALGQTSYVEGTVDNFVPMPYSGHTPGLESFTVSGVPFSYSDYIPVAGFNLTSSHGGPIRQGLPVRIWYVGNEIVKLEIKK